MRGRKPRPLTIAPADLPVLRLIAQGNGLPWYQVRRAQIVLAMAAGRRTSELSEETGCDTSTIWRLCRRYEQGGLSGLLADGRKKRLAPHSSSAHSLFGSTLPGHVG
ncbi:MAG: helix-turn-helix domain-containing protein [Gemmataceae bacterium]|nr:helix-turn-helix domain-containing protein [Gemmataceae bacterium]